MVKLTKEDPAIKTFNLKMSIATWKLIKMSAMHMDISMNEFIIMAIDNFKYVNK